MKTFRILVLVVLLALVASVRAEGPVVRKAAAPTRLCCHGLLGDLNGDGKVDIFDFALFSSSWLKCEGTPGYNQRADLDCDGCVNQRDFEILKIEYGR